MSAFEYSRWDTHPTTSLLDLEGCYEDMLSASDFFDRFVEEFSSRDYVLLDALATAAVVRYGRSFGPGIRHQLNIGQLPDATAEDLALHGDLLAIRNKHSAHPINMQETHSVLVGHSANENGQQVTVVSSSTLVATAISVDLAKQASQLCLRWTDWLSGEKQRECTRLLETARNLSNTEIAALPKGPVDVSRNLHRGRRQRR